VHRVLKIGDMFSHLLLWWIVLMLLCQEVNSLSLSFMKFSFDPVLLWIEKCWDTLWALGNALRSFQQQPWR
jgi:hypothetical protein